MLSEFDLIRRYFQRPHHPGRAVLGIGDDCALLAPRPGLQLAVSTDMLVEGRHFFAGADPRQLGHKALAVNLSDLAAMGARPVAFTLSLALPAADPAWLEPFAAGLFALADEHRCELIGGDTTKGPLTISITVFGEIAPGHALRRADAQVGDDVWVSGTLGDARLALAGYLHEVPLTAGELAAAAPRMHAPTPRVALGRALAGGAAIPDTAGNARSPGLGIDVGSGAGAGAGAGMGNATGDGAAPRLAHAALDISDGLIGDLGHILAASNVGATLDADALPAGPALATQPPELRRRFTAAGGDDYELCFTAPAAHRAAIAAAGERTGTPVTRVGTIEAAPGLRFVDAAGQPLDLQLRAWDHFSAD